MTITQERLRELLAYDAQTGVFTWKVRTSNRVAVGDIAGNRVKGGYRQISVDGVSYLANRLAWLYVYGVMPSTGIDHKYGADAGDGIANLRLATQAQNMQNERGPRKSNRSGFMGVARCDSVCEKWFARVMVGGKAINLGRFDTPEQAHEAYLVGKSIHHPFSMLRQ